MQNVDFKLYIQIWWMLNELQKFCTLPPVHDEVCFFPYIIIIIFISRFIISLSFPNPNSRTVGWILNLSFCLQLSLGFMPSAVHCNTEYTQFKPLQEWLLTTYLSWLHSPLLICSIIFIYKNAVIHCSPNLIKKIICNLSLILKSYILWKILVKYQ